MLNSFRILRPKIRPSLVGKNLCYRRTYIVLGIETSCDDTSVCLYNRFSKDEPPKLLGDIKRSLDNRQFGGIVPTRAFDHHEANLGPAVSSLLKANPGTKPDLICVTRGPGMRGGLTIGLEMAKGLSLAWDVPMIGVNHMLGHLLTPRLLSNGKSPSFPFLSLLVSGGHTMLVLSRGILDHEIIANTLDIAVGDAIDKCGRELGLEGNMIGPELEKLVDEYEGSVNDGRYARLCADDLQTTGIHVTMPLKNKRGRIDRAAFSFAGFESMLKRGLEKKGGVSSLSSLDQMIIAKQIQNIIFGHIIERVRLSLNTVPYEILSSIKDFVCSGGVAANKFLREMLRESLPHEWNMHFPPLELCTDNSHMIAWAGIELWESESLHTSLEAMPVTKWSLEELLTGVDAWQKSDTIV
ncbi:glycoprotease family-domain-containing protein [Dipodascopsis uninucleata]